VTVPVRRSVAGLPRYVAGKAAGRDIDAHKLSSNENPYPPLPGVLEATARACARLNRYPDMANSAVTAAVADRLSVHPTQLAFGAGSVAVLYSLLQTVCEPGDEVIFAWRSFEAYPIAVQLTGARPVPVPLGPGAVHDLTAMRAAVNQATRAILLCTPNNPTGPALAHDAVINFVDSLPEDILIILDEAYVEFVTDPQAVHGFEVLSGRTNVAVLRTFSKAYGLAGLRIGYGVMEPELAAAVRTASLPFGVSNVASAAAIASLAAEDELMARVAGLIKARDELAHGLLDLTFDVPDAQGNFVWLAAGPLTADYARAFAAGGIAVRPFVAGDEEDGIRITVGEPEANSRVIAIASTLPH
jgi:histidinol-phosphate aminotransferase